jgi:hypothetical protein
MGGDATNGDTLANVTTGNGSSGGAGGSANGGDAGVYNASNTISGGFTNTSGITVLSQNTGANSLVQQGVTVQANINP